jgi:hypothetical protein
MTNPTDILDMNILRAAPGYYYVATPYSKYPQGIEAAFREACRAAAWLTLEGVRVYCPISHTHPIAIYGGIDPMRHDIWLPADKPLMDGAVGLIVCMMATWEQSYGIGVEIDEFRKAGKPVYFMEWPRRD